MAFLEPKIVAVKALQILKDELVFRNLLNRDYEADYHQVGDTISVRKRIAGKSELFDGQVNGQEAVEEPVNITLDRHRDYTTVLEPKDETLNIVDFASQVIEPAMVSLAEGVEEDCAAFVVSQATKKVEYTANPTDLKKIAELGKALDKAKAPMSNRSLVFSTDHKFDYATCTNLSEVNKAGDNMALREARVGKLYGMDTFFTQAMPESTASVSGNATAFKVSGTKGDKHVALSNVQGASGTIKNGDCFIVDGHVYHFTGDYTASGSAVSSANIDRPLHKTLSNVDAIINNKPTSVAFQKDAVLFVNCPLANPQGAVKSYTAVADGLAVRVVYGYDQDTKQDKVSFDVLYGFGVARPEFICKLQ